MIVPTTSCSDNCLPKELLEYYQKIVQRYQQTVTKNDRLCSLAKPKFIAPPRQIVSSQCAAVNRKVTIEDLSYRVGTRTEQLAFPRVRKLKELRECPAYQRYCRRQKQNVNCMLRKSLLSLYSRLSNVMPPYEEKDQHKYSTEELLNQKKAMRRLSRPVKRTKRKNTELDDSPIPKRLPDLERIKELAQPRKIKVEEPALVWHLKPNLINYQPTERLQKLAAPVKRLFSYNEPSKFTVPRPLDVQYIFRLAVPRRINQAVTKPSITYPISKGAQNAIASPRTIKLAAPRSYININIRATPFKVSRNALYAKPTQRIIQLAKPRKRSPYS